LLQISPTIVTSSEHAQTSMPTRAGARLMQPETVSLESPDSRIEDRHVTAKRPARAPCGASEPHRGAQPQAGRRGPPLRRDRVDQELRDVATPRPRSGGRPAPSVVALQRLADMTDQVTDAARIAPTRCRTMPGFSPDCPQRPPSRESRRWRSAGCR
jgi:hypothetical protein